MTRLRLVLGGMALVVAGAGATMLVDTARAQQQAPNPYPVCNTCDPASAAVTLRVHLPGDGELVDALTVPEGQRFILEHVAADLWTGPCAYPIGLRLNVGAVPLTALRSWSHSSGGYNAAYVSDRTQMYFGPGTRLRAGMMVQRFPECLRGGPLGAPPSVTLFGRYVPAF